MKIVGYVVHYENEFDGGAYLPSQGPAIAIGMNPTQFAMMQDRPEATVCITPVDQVPEWVESV